MCSASIGISDWVGMRLTYEYVLIGTPRVQTELPLNLPISRPSVSTTRPEIRRFLLIGSPLGRWSNWSRPSASPRPRDTVVGSGDLDFPLARSSTALQDLSMVVDRELSTVVVVLPLIGDLGLSNCCWSSRPMLLLRLLLSFPVGDSGLTSTNSQSLSIRVVVGMLPRLVGLDLPLPLPPLCCGLSLPAPVVLSESFVLPLFVRSGSIPFPHFLQPLQKQRLPSMRPSEVALKTCLKWYM